MMNPNKVIITPTISTVELSTIATISPVLRDTLPDKVGINIIPVCWTVGFTAQKLQLICIMKH